MKRVWKSCAYNLYEVLNSRVVLSRTMYILELWREARKKNTNINIMNRAYHTLNTVENLKLFYVFLLCLYYGSLISCHVMSVVQFEKHHVIMLNFLPTTDNIILQAIRI